MPIKLVFFFDSEDYETPAADDAEKWWAETMGKHGITVCINVVGELARALRERGRSDVIRAMARHDIAYHSDMHSAYPTWAEYLDTLSWAEGIARVLREEIKGIADVEEVFGQHPAVWCKPGASWGPQVVQAMLQMDVPVFCDAPFEMAPGQPLWYGNGLFLTYHHHFDGYFQTPHAERLERMKADFTALCEQHDGRYLAMFTHPSRLFTTRFSDTFSGGKNPPREQWKPSPLRPAQEIHELQQDFDDFLAWVVRQPDVELTTHRALFAWWKQPVSPWLSAGAVSRLAASLPAFTYQRVGDEYLSPAEQFGVIARAVATGGEEGIAPNQIPVRRLLGPTATPPEAAPGSVPWREFAVAARWVDEFCTRTRHVPAAIALGRSAVGPNAFLQAAGRALCAQESHGTVPATVSIQPVDEYPAITRREDFRRQRFHQTWSEFSPDFEGRNVLEMIRLQAWTAKPVMV